MTVTNALLARLIISLIGSGCIVHIHITAAQMMVMFPGANRDGDVVYTVHKRSSRWGGQQ